jgi:hypothetical protein
MDVPKLQTVGWLGGRAPSGPPLHRGAAHIWSGDTWMLAHPRPYPARDAVWRELVGMARTSDPTWTVAAVGMALPALTRFAGRRLPR